MSKHPHSAFIAEAVQNFDRAIEGALLVKCSRNSAVMATVPTFYCFMQR